MWLVVLVLIVLGAVWLLRKNVSTQVDAVQTMADQLGPEEAVWAFNLVFSGLCSYLDDPDGQLAASRNKRRFLEPAVALFQRLKVLGVITSTKNKGQFRMGLTSAVMRDADFRSKGFTTNRRTLSDYDIVSSLHVPDLPELDQQRVSNLVFGMQDLAN